jgi:hypothetical protein
MFKVRQISVFCSFFLDFYLEKTLFGILNFRIVFYSDINCFESFARKDVFIKNLNILYLKFSSKRKREAKSL